MRPNIKRPKSVIHPLKLSCPEPSDQLMFKSQLSLADDRDEAVTVMGKAPVNFVKIALDTCVLAGDIGLGGTGSTSLQSSPFRVLPIVLPKIIVSPITLMRGTVDEKKELAGFIAQKLNKFQSKIRDCLTGKGVSALDVPNKAFHDPEATTALINELQILIKIYQHRQAPFFKFWTSHCRV